MPPSLNVFKSAWAGTAISKATAALKGACATMCCQVFTRCLNASGDCSATAARALQGGQMLKGVNGVQAQREAAAAEGEKAKRTAQQLLTLARQTCKVTESYEVSNPPSNTKPPSPNHNREVECIVINEHCCE